MGTPTQDATIEPKSNLFARAWDYFNGKKTNIGAAILMIAFVITQVDQQVAVGIWGITLPDWVDKAVQTLEWFGTAIAGLGLGHQAVKQGDKPVS